MPEENKLYLYLIKNIRILKLDCKVVKNKHGTGNIFRKTIMADRYIRCLSLQKVKSNHRVRIAEKTDYFFTLNELYINIYMD